MSKYIVETFYTCAFKITHKLDELNEKKLSELENRNDGEVQIIDVKLNNRKTKTSDSKKNLDNTFNKLQNKNTTTISSMVSEKIVSSDKLQITVNGCGSHAAFPHQGTDPTVIAAHVIVALQSIASRMTNPLDAVVVTIARISGGSGFNIIPSKVELAGTVRTLNSDTRRKTHDHIAKIAENTAAAFGGSADVNIIDGYPVLENNPKATDVVSSIADSIPNVSPMAMDPVMGGEDFAFYAQRVPAAFYALGVCPKDTEHYPLLHQPNYDFADAAIPYGVRMHSEIALRFWDHWSAA